MASLLVLPLQHFPKRVPPEAINATIGALLSVITSENAQDEDQLNVTENAVSALGNVLQAFGSQIASAKGETAVNGLWSLWVNNQPLVEDEMEAKEVHGRLLRMVMDKDPRVLGANNENMPQVC